MAKILEIGKRDPLGLALAGLKGKSTHRGLEQLLAATGLNFSAGAAHALKSRDEDREEDDSPGMKDVALSGTSMAALERAKRLLSWVENFDQVVEVKADVDIIAVFER